jgi:hypothetical protein
LFDVHRAGSHVECQHALFSFGVRRDQFPLTVDGALKREQFLEWQRDQQAIEEAKLVLGAEQPPTANDLQEQQGAQRQFVVSSPLPISDMSFGREGTPVKKNQLVDVIPDVLSRQRQMMRCLEKGRPSKSTRQTFHCTVHWTKG